MILYTLQNGLREKAGLAPPRTMRKTKIKVKVRVTEADPRVEIGTKGVIGVKTVQKAEGGGRNRLKVGEKCKIMGP